jgi:D-arabinose 5-phosphate isomerase GutQ
MNHDEIMTLARQTVEKDSRVVASLADQLGESFTAVVNMLFECQGHVLVAGSGTSHAVGARLAHLLSCCGTPSLFIHPGDAQHGLSGAVTPRDVLIAISKGGETSEVNALARITKTRGARVVALTEKPTSTLAGLSDLVLVTQAPEESDPYGMIATGSSLFNCALSDAICTVLLHMRGYTRQQFAQTHPGGAVGKKIEKINREEE